MSAFVVPDTQSQLAGELGLLRRSIPYKQVTAS
jgi:hypothetical protein